MPPSPFRSIAPPTNFGSPESVWLRLPREDEEPGLSPAAGGAAAGPGIAPPRLALPAGEQEEDAAEGIFVCGEAQTRELSKMVLVLVVVVVVV